MPAGPPGPRGFARASVIRDVRIASDHAVVGKRRRWRKGNIRENAGSCYKGVWIAGGHAVAGKRRRWRKGNIRENAGSCYKGRVDC